jgi:DNA helicase IV
MARQYKAPKLEKLLNRSLLAQVSEPVQDLKSEYKFIRRVIRRREKQFQKQGAGDLFREQYSGSNIKSLRELTDTQSLVSELNRLEAFLRDPRSSVAGALRAQEVIEKRRQSLSETLGRELSASEYDNIGKFLGAMQSRVGEMWKDWSETSVQLFEEAQRLNLDPEQFLRNYQYWLDHAEDLQEARPLNYANLKPSSYIRQLGIESVREWRSAQIEEE